MPAPVKSVWRFYTNRDGCWRWEELNANDKTLIRRSPACYKEYDECVAAARRAGYRFEAAQVAGPVKILRRPHKRPDR